MRLTEQALLSAASQQSGLSDFGNADFLLAFRLLIESYETEVRLHPIGRMLVQQELVRMLLNRLQIQETFKQYPDILEKPIHRPLVIIGLPRTGTTLLFNLLAQDPDARVPFIWELLWPAPLPEENEGHRDKRMERARTRLQMLHRMVPEMVAIHAMTETSPEECHFLFQNAFASSSLGVFTHSKTYLNWLANHDMIPEYSYYKQQLQLLQWQSSRNYWILKSPFHLFYLDALLTVFPDARIIQLHRDPEKVIASNCSLMDQTRKLYTADRKASETGEICVSLLATAANSVTRVRKSRQAEQFLDVFYPDLILDPLKTARRIYDHFGLVISEPMAINMERWLKKNPQNKNGVHRYSLHEFGLNEESVHRRFQDYKEHFKIPSEGS